MRQVVDNLTINAINFSEKGLIVVEVRTSGDNAVMMMCDEGIGMQKHEKFDLFDPVRMGSNTATKAEGRGVGLALCKSAVEAHDGIITAESPEGKGAVFYVVLPRY
ncbi:MAG TPA: ATP-binding protein [Candidatus Megaira endosymbiont of Nemacystus decipiens]|nr:ATP-binding protein [Candidatus Megaera endosymbiont of Nemacystus decipiens]